MRHHRELFENVRKRTGMFFRNETYDVVAAFVYGYDQAYEGGLLRGFREWLIVRLRTGSNLAWPALVAHAAFPNAKSPQNEVCVDAATERRAIDTLFDLLGEFDEVVGKHDGLKDIFREYEAYMHAYAHEGSDTK